MPPTSDGYEKLPTYTTDAPKKNQSEGNPPSDIIAYIINNKSCTHPGSSPGSMSCYSLLGDCGYTVLTQDPAQDPWAATACLVTTQYRDLDT